MSVREPGPSPMGPWGSQPPPPGGVNDAAVLRLMVELERLADVHGEAVMLEVCRQFLDTFHRELRAATAEARLWEE